MRKLENPGRYPPHKLRLKVGAKVMVLRNLSPADRLMNGTMGIVRAIHTFWIWLETESGLHVIPRINFTINIKRCNYVCNRRQFPLRLAYCKTVHKAQGATLKRLGGDLREDPFSHGQLYVLLGRSRNSESAAVLVHPEMKDGDGTALTANIVFNELLTRSDCKCPLEVLHDHSPLTPVVDSAWEMKPHAPPPAHAPAAVDAADAIMEDADAMDAVSGGNDDDGDAEIFDPEHPGWQPQLVGTEQLVSSSGEAYTVARGSLAE